MIAISKIRRIETDKQNRSDAINRRMTDDKSEIDALKFEVKMHQFFIVFLILVFSSAILGLK